MYHFPIHAPSIYPINQKILLNGIDKIVQELLKPMPNIVFLVCCLNQYYAPFMNSLDDNLKYCDTIDCFIKCTRSVVGHFYINEVVWCDDLVLDLIAVYQKHCHQYILYQNFYYQEQKNTQELEQYVSNLIHHYSRLLFVRVDLKYSYDADVSPFDFYHHMDKLRQLIANKKSCFRYLQGYAWALEQSENGGYHCHLLLIYDGNKKHKAWHIANKVGEKWQKITGNLGIYFNCHDTNYVRQFEMQGKLGIGMIHRDNLQEVANAICTASYLTQASKYEQRLKVKVRGMRTFGHGQFDTSNRRGINCPLIHS